MENSYKNKNEWIGSSKYYNVSKFNPEEEYLSRTLSDFVYDKNLLLRQTAVNFKINSCS